MSGPEEKNVIPLRAKQAVKPDVVPGPLFESHFAVELPRGPLPVETVLGYDSRALAIPARFLDGIVEVDDGDIIKVSEDVVIQALRVRRQIERATRRLKSSIEGHVGVESIKAVETAAAEQLAHFYVSLQDEDIVFVNDRFILPVEPEQQGENHD